MTSLSIDLVNEIIELAIACYPTDGEAAVVSLSNMSFEEKPEKVALYEKVASLNSNELAELQALMLLGRGADEEQASDWGLLVSGSFASQGSETVSYIASKYQLARYLSQGIAKLDR
ncbi:DUF3775 domain-containing protein [Photobacterium sanguinicancri]|uniref:DUF3775 domain-containing protein n=1 Tax=Photobacterium sanguinicancri TaxID=875932 RepID=UPI00247FCA22|nr:DUF3775 domain-containing protein [Photobacterium sanguinicancri]